MLCSKCSEPIRPVLALDIDGTIGDYHNHFLRFCDGYFGREMPRGWDGTGEWEDFLGLNKRDYRDAKLAYRQGGLKRTMPLLQGALSLLNYIDRDLDAELWIATTRPWQRLDNIDPDTREWLRRNDIRFDGLLYGENKYDQLIETVDPTRILGAIDDLPEQVEIAYSLGIPVFHRYNHHNQARRFAPGGWTSGAIDWIEIQYKEWRKKNDD